MGQGQGTPLASFLEGPGGFLFLVFFLFSFLSILKRPLIFLGSLCLKQELRNNGACVSGLLMSLGSAGENVFFFPHIPYPAASKDINAADWLPNGP